MSKVVHARMMSRFLAINDAVGLLIISSSNLVVSSARFMMVFFVFRMIFYVISSLTAMMRRLPNFYIPAIHEMDDETYWGMILMVMFAMKFTFVDRFIQIPPFLTYISLTTATYFVVTLLMKFQSQHWSVEIRAEREVRIAQLASKVKLSKSELDTLRPFFIERVQKSQHVPLRWRVIGILVTIIIGAVISTYVDGLFDWIGQTP